MKWDKQIIYKKIDTPPPPQHLKSKQRNIVDIDSHCPYLLSGETTFHLTS